MRRRKNVLPLLGIFTVLFTGVLPAQEKSKAKSDGGHSHAESEIHGGEVTMTWAHHFEVVWRADQVMVYLYDVDQKPLPAKGVSGEVTFKFKNRPEQKVTLTMIEAEKVPADSTISAKSDMAPTPKEETAVPPQRLSNQDHLVASINLAEVKDGELKANFTFKGLPDKGESKAKFSVKYQKMKPRETGHHEIHH
jgi:hypothetical protein